MYAQQITAKGKDLSHLTSIHEKYLDQDMQVIILYGESGKEAYDIVNDPDWIVVTEENEAAYKQAKKELENGEVFLLEDIKKEFNYV